MRSWAYNGFGVLMGTSWQASGPRWPSLRTDSLPMITLFHSQGDFCATALRVLRNVEHCLVHRVEQCDNKIWGSHRTGSSWLKSVQPQLAPVRDYLSTRTLMLRIKLSPLVSNQWC